MTIKDQEIAFPDRGLVLVNGRNLSNSGQFESIGSGKTGLGEALSRALVGVDGRYANLGHFCQSTKDELMVEVKAELSGKPMVITMGHRLAELSLTGEGLKFVFDGEVINRPKASQTRDELSRTIGISQQLAEWTIFVNGDLLHFNRLSHTELVALMMDVLRQPKWDTHYLAAKRSLDTTIQSILTHDGAAQSLKTAITTALNAIESAKAAVVAQRELFDQAMAINESQLTEANAKLLRLTSNIGTLVDQQSAIKRNIKTIEAEAADRVQALEVQEIEAQAGQSTIVLEGRRLATELSKLEAAKREAVSAFNTLNNVAQTCPTCHRPWNNRPDQTSLDSASAKVAEAELRLSNIRVHINTNLEKERLGLAHIQEIRQNQRSLGIKEKVKNLSTELDTIDTRLQKLTTDVNETTETIGKLKQGPSKDELIRAEATLDVQNQTLSGHQDQLAKTEAELTEFKQLEQVLEYWVRGFGPSGIQNLVLQKAIPPLNQVAGALSHRMTAGTLSIKYETSKELASGETRSHLNVHVTNTMGAKRAAGGSKGEQGLINLIIAETLATVGQVTSRINYRWFDEVVNGQDSTVRRAILTYLKELAVNENSIIFVVDHHPESISYADYVLTATKDEHGVTSYDWQ